MSLPAKFPRTPILCYVTDRKSLASSPGEARTDLLERVASAAAAGVDWIQIREKDLPGKEIASVVRDSLAAVRGTNRQGNAAERIMVNDRVDVALSERAGGVHLGGNSLPVGDITRWIGGRLERAASSGFLVGVSCHSLKSAREAVRDGAGYIFFGPVFSTPSKAAFGAPQGLDRLRAVCDDVALPVLAIGGITLANASSCLDAGAAGIAAISLFQHATDLPALIGKLRAGHT